jgi:hypothetical protein
VQVLEEASMRFDVNCRISVAECLQMAECARDPKAKATWLKLAQLWRLELAEEKRKFAR